MFMQLEMQVRRMLSQFLAICISHRLPRSYGLFLLGVCDIYKSMTVVSDYLSIQLRSVAKQFAIES
jgi:hypothetical protein